MKPSTKNTPPAESLPRSTAAPQPIDHKDWSQKVAQEFVDSLNKQTAEAKPKRS